MRRYFGTDGIRGKANTEPMTPEMAMRLGQVLAWHFAKDHPEPRILIGKDPRRSSYIFEFAVAAGACSMGASTYQVGPLPTPAIAFLTHKMRAQAGVMISASHNPFEDNGIKVFGGDGYKLPDEVEATLEGLLDDGFGEESRPSGADVGRAYRIADAQGRYIVFAQEAFPDDLSLHGLRIVIDCANGAGYRVGPAILEELGAQVIERGVWPDGTNINRRCGALHPEFMAQAVVQEGADLGIALDGDGDRLILSDEKGRIVDGDAVMALIGAQMLRESRLPKNTLVATVMSNLGLDRRIEEAGGKVVRTQVGDRYVLQRMREDGYGFGGEQSGHMIFLDHASTGDGMVSSLQVLATMIRSEKPLSELADCMERFPQVHRTVNVTRKPALEDLPTVRKAIKTAEDEMGEDGRTVVRYSGTENVLRVLVEYSDEAQACVHADRIVDAAVDAIGSLSTGSLLPQ